MCVWLSYAVVPTIAYVSPYVLSLVYTWLHMFCMILYSSLHILCTRFLCFVWLSYAVVPMASACVCGCHVCDV